MMVISHASARRLDRAGWRVHEGIVKKPGPADPYKVREEWLTTLENITCRCREVPTVGDGALSVAWCRGYKPGAVRGTHAAPCRGQEPGEVRGPSIGVRFDAPKDLQKWVRKSRVDFLEVYSGTGNLTSAVSRAGLKAAEGLDSKVVAYNRNWDLSDKDMVTEFAWLVCVWL